MGGKKEEGDTEKEAAIETIAGCDKVELVKEATPEFSGKESGKGGDHYEEEGDGRVVGIDAVLGIGEVFDADGQGDEVAETEEHPCAEDEAEESVFPDEAEALPGIAYMLG